MPKREFCSITWKSVPYDIWLRICLINPAECITLAIPDRGTYVLYKAYWISEYLPEKKIFDMVFPLPLFERALVTVPQDLRTGDRPVQFEFKKLADEMVFREWKVL